MKQSIKIVFKRNENTEASDAICNTIRSIFSEYADVENVYLDSLAPGEIIPGDLFVLNSMKYLETCIEHTKAPDRLIRLERSIEEKYFSAIKAIPPGSKVLIVNDEQSSSQEAADMLIMLGFTDYDMVVFNPEDPDNPEFQNFEYAITPAEPHLVPPGTRHVVDIGYRKVAFETILSIKRAIGIDNEDINLKLFSYSSTILEPVQDFKDTYINSYLKSRMLNDYAYGIPVAMFLFNYKKQLVYSNHHAENMFPLLKETKIATVNDVSPELARIYDELDEEAQACELAGKACLVDKKSINLENLVLGQLVTIRDEANIREMERTINQKLIEKGLFARYTFNDIVGESDTLIRCINLAKKAAKTDYTILITGESGVGKELFAQSIHNHSERKDQPFIGVNCAAIPENLLESELFGYDSGAFTGANKGGRMGYFERANHGTIFLDEIGDISPGLQSKLLRVLQERQVMRVGADRVIDIDVRIIAATNKDLLEEVQQGRFRNDLYYRLNALQIRVPSLRERPEDVPLLFNTFMGNEYAAIGNETLKKLKSYKWPGNIRELENCVLYYKTLGQLPEQFVVDGVSDIHTVPKTAEEPASEKEPVVSDNPQQAETPLWEKIGSESELEMIIHSDQDLDESIRNEVLILLGTDNALGHGQGRTVILACLKKKGYVVSDRQLRVILSELADAGYIAIGKGRQGTKITDKGIRKIYEICQENSR